jgi:hypothetical protein
MSLSLGMEYSLKENEMRHYGINMAMTGGSVGGGRSGRDVSPGSRVKLDSTSPLRQHYEYPSQYAREDFNNTQTLAGRLGGFPPQMMQQRPLYPVGGGYHQ